MNLLSIITSICSSELSSDFQSIVYLSNSSGSLSLFAWCQFPPQQAAVFREKALKTYSKLSALHQTADGHS